MTHSAPSGTRRDPDDIQTRREVIVVGGGQAGLAIGYFLAQQGRGFAILEASDQSAAAWRARWDSLRLFMSARYSSLPGLPFPGDPDRYPTRDEVVAYLAEYARRLQLPVELGSRVRSLRRTDGTYLLETDDRTYAAGPSGCSDGTDAEYLAREISRFQTPAPIETPAREPAA